MTLDGGEEASVLHEQTAAPSLKPWTAMTPCAIPFSVAGGVTSESRVTSAGIVLRQCLKSCFRELPLFVFSLFCVLGVMHSKLCCC